MKFINIVSYIICAIFPTVGCRLSIKINCHFLVTFWCLGRFILLLKYSSNIYWTTITNSLRTFPLKLYSVVDIYSYIYMHNAARLWISFFPINTCRPFYHYWMDFPDRSRPLCQPVISDVFDFTYDLLLDRVTSVASIVDLHVISLQPLVWHHHLEWNNIYFTT